MEILAPKLMIKLCIFKFLQCQFWNIIFKLTVLLVFVFFWPQFDNRSILATGFHIISFILKHREFLMLLFNDNLQRKWYLELKEENMRHVHRLEPNLLCLELFIESLSLKHTCITLTQDLLNQIAPFRTIRTFWWPIYSLIYDYILRERGIQCTLHIRILKRRLLKLYLIDFLFPLQIIVIVSIKRTIKISKIN